MIKASVKHLVIRPLEESELLAAARLCAQAMLNNPLHVRVFGRENTLRQRRLNRFFPELLAYVHRKGGLYGAFIDQRLVGVLGMLSPHHCKPSAIDVFRLLPSLLRSNRLIGVIRLGMWLGTWAKLDPKTPHWHLGPLAIDPQWQRQGIGTQLIEFACGKGEGLPLYLETDKLNNVQLYEKFGFSTVATPVILGVSSWMMLRL